MEDEKLKTEAEETTEKEDSAEEKEPCKEETKEVKEESSEPNRKEKKNKYKEQVEKLEADLAKQKNEYLKVFAEMENTKRRLKDEAIKDRKYASMKVVSELITPIDMLLKILSMDNPNPEIKNYCFGFQMIANQIVDVLKAEGLTEVKAQVGDDFDPQFMQAVETVTGEEDNKIAVIMQNGYLYKDRMIRPAMVKVTKKEVVATEATETTEDKSEEKKEII